MSVCSAISLPEEEERETDTDGETSRLKDRAMGIDSVTGREKQQLGTDIEGE